MKEFITKKQIILLKGLQLVNWKCGWKNLPLFHHVTRLPLTKVTELVGSMNIFIFLYCISSVLFSRIGNYTYIALVALSWLLRLLCWAGRSRKWRKPQVQLLRQYKTSSLSKLGQNAPLFATWRLCARPRLCKILQIWNTTGTVLSCASWQNWLVDCGITSLVHRSGRNYFLIGSPLSICHTWHWLLRWDLIFFKTALLVNWPRR